MKYEIKLNSIFISSVFSLYLLECDDIGTERDMECKKDVTKSIWYCLKLKNNPFRNLELNRQKIFLSNNLCMTFRYCMRIKLILRINKMKEKLIYLFLFLMQNKLIFYKSQK